MVRLKLITMYKVIKEYAGVQVGSEVNIHPKHLNHMLKNGYIEPIQEAENKMIEPIYKNKTVRKKRK